MRIEHDSATTAKDTIDRSKYYLYVAVQELSEKEDKPSTSGMSDYAFLDWDNPGQGMLIKSYVPVNVFVYKY